ncbi:hypothetical protein Tco_0971326 [Tanacetum coccineum]
MRHSMRMLAKDTRSQDGKDDKDNDKGSKLRSQSMKEQAYNKEQRERPRPHELNDKSKLIDLMKESHSNGVSNGYFQQGRITEVHNMKDSHYSSLLLQKLHKLDEREETNNIDWNTIAEQVQERQSDTIKRYQTLKKKPVSVAQARKNMMIYLKNMAGYKMGYFKGMSYDEIRPIFEEEYNKIQTLTAEASRSEPIQEQPTEEPKELSEEELKKMMEIVPVEEIKAEALQMHIDPLNIRKELYGFNWKDKEIELWVELKMLFEPNAENLLELQKYMHDPLKWWLYDMCAVHHVSTEKGQDIFMLVEKDYPLTKGLATLMLCNKLRVDQQSEMADELLIKIYNIANRPRK